MSEQQKPAGWRPKLSWSAPFEVGAPDSHTIKYWKLRDVEIEYCYLRSSDGQSPYTRAVDDELVSTHLGVAQDTDTVEQAKKKLSTLIQWHIDVALDPKVNGGYELVRKKDWVGLTDEEIHEFRETNSTGRGAGWIFDFKGFARCIESKLRKKNGGTT